MDEERKKLVDEFLAQGQNQWISYIDDDLIAPAISLEALQAAIQKAWEGMSIPNMDMTWYTQSEAPQPEG